MNMKNNSVTYSTVGDYQLPNLTLPQSEVALGKYGRMRWTYLMQEHPTKYTVMLLNGTLYPHLNEVQRTAELWLAGHETALQPRFDVIEVYAPDGVNTRRPEIVHWENVF